MSTNVQLPVVSAPDWEVSEENEEYEEDESDLQGIPESLALHHSLRQSRNAWLTAVFPKFSSKVRGKHQPEVPNPHPHTIRLVGKCDLEIGPHVFHDTSFFEVHYNSQPAPVTTYQFVQNPSFPGLPAGSYDASASTSASSSSVTPSPLMSSLDSSIKITPHLIAQVNAAASSNPVLQNLLHAAAHNTASIDQLKTLAALIQSLATQPTAPYPNAAFDPNSHTPASSLLGMNPQSSTSQDSKVLAKKSDFLVEFRENQNERLLLPQSIIFGERHPLPDPAGRCDVVLGFFVPWTESQGKDISERPAILKLRKAPIALRDAFWNWLPEDARTPAAKQVFNQKIKEGPERVFLQHRLPDGDLISQLRGASKSYPMRSIKPSASTLILSKPKRPPRKRKPPTTPTSTLPPPAIPPQVIPTPSVIQLPAVSTHKRPLEPATTPTQKKPKASKAMKALPAFACSVCGMTNVPLMQGGRFCRTCLDAGASRNSPLPPAPSVQPPPHMASLTQVAPQPSSQIGRIDTFRGFIHHTVASQTPSSNEGVT